MDVIGWLLDSDPAIRWQVQRDLTDAPAEVVAAERARITTVGWGARPLALEDEDGQWDGGALFPARLDEARGMDQFGPGQPWSATAYSLMLLRDFGVDPQSDQMRRAIALVKENSHWLFRRHSTGQVVDPDWLQFSFPTRWHYDVLRGLEYFWDLGGTPDPRLDEAMDLMRSKQQPDGTWLLENTHPGKVWFALDDGDGKPSRWNTLRALRVLRWYEQINST